MLTTASVLASLLLLSSLKASAPGCPLAKAHQYQILVFDAGSTGTRLTLFDIEDSNPFYHVMSHKLKLRNVLSLGKLSALSSMVNNLDEGLKKELDDLLASKVRTEPSLLPACYSSIPLYMLATAGLRALSQQDARKVIEFLDHEFTTTWPFAYEHGNSRIFTGREEGVDLWIGANVVYKKIDHGDPEQNFILLDMGGGSTQVTVSMDMGQLKKHHLERNPDAALTRIFDMPYLLYSHSYMQAGIQAMRAQFFDQGRSVCLHPEAVLPYEFGQAKYTLRGESYPDEFRFEECLNRAKNQVSYLQVDKIWSPRERELPQIQAVSSFFYTIKMGQELLCQEAADKAEINCTATDQAVNKTVGDIKQMTEGICVNPPNTGNSFKDYICIDLSYVYALLHFGYGLGDHVTILFSNEARDVKLDWSLGFAMEQAFAHFQKQHKLKMLLRKR